jgi:hypothetical protein
MRSSSNQNNNSNSGQVPGSFSRNNR